MQKRIISDKALAELKVKAFLLRLSEEFTSIERMNLSKVAPSFVSELQFGNYLGIKEILDYLLTNNEITQDINNKLIALFLEQGIDLNNLS